jgi:hypothetical protein
MADTDRADKSEGRIGPTGCWEPTPGSRFRALTAQEVRELEASPVPAEFGGPHNAKWHDHHPVARAAWEKRGGKPADA